MLEVIILILSVLANSILGLAVYIKNPRKDTNRLFFYLTISLSVWLVITYFSLHPFLFGQLEWVRLVLAAAAVLSYFVLTSFAVFPEGEFASLRFINPITYYMLAVVFLTQTPLIFKSLDYDTAGRAQPVPGPGIILFALLAVSFLGGAVYVLARKYRRSYGAIRNQLRIVIFGIATSFASILLTNFVLVSIFKNTSLISFAPLLTLILTGAMAYAILKHRLFDLRLAVARAVAYVMTFSLVIIVYSGLAFLIGEIFSFQDKPLNTGQRFFYIGLAVITAVAFQPLKKFFDRATNKFFYRDAYDPQSLLDNLSNSVVGNIRMEPLLAQSSKVITSHMKLTGCSFIVHFPDNNYRTFGKIEQGQLSEQLLSKLRAHHEQILIADDIPYSQQAFRKLLQDFDCAAVIRLSTHNARVGYLLVGNKKSGDVLNSADVRLLNVMADELAIALENSLRFEEISQFNVTLQEKVDDATKQLRHANQKLKELDATKDEFISMASHQLRTPLTSIKGYLSMVLEGDVGAVKKDQQKMIQQAFDSAEQMVFLIADLLNVSRLQSGKFVIENKPTDMAKLVGSEVERLAETAKKHGVSLKADISDNFPALNLDENKIRQVVMNFIDNAIYYTPSGGSIDVKLAAGPHDITYMVTDTGLGVPASVQHKLFSKFYRADNARKMRPDGTGLGLFMAKKVIVAQGGAIIFKSTEGKGSTFGFSFPRSKVEIKAQKPAVAAAK